MLLDLRSLWERAPALITPATAGLTLTGFAPSVSTPQVVIPSARALVLATFAPVISTPRLVIPGTRAHVLTGFAPTVATPRNVAPVTATLVLTRFAPSVATPRVAVPGAKALALTCYAPAVGVGINAVPGVKALVLTTFAPTVSAPRVVSPTTKVLTLTGSAPVVSTPRQIVPRRTALFLTLFAPFIDISQGGSELTYATVADLEVILGTVPPVGASRLLDRASELVDSVLTSGMYAVDANGLATDATVLAALNKATCLQVESWLASGDEFDELGDWTSYTMAGLSVSRRPNGRHSRLCDRSLDALRLAKLIPGTVFPT